jgi:uncharacterized membrane protein
MKLLMTFLLALAIPAAVWGTEYRFRSVDFPGAANTALYAISDLGQFVGAKKNSAGKHHAIVGQGDQLAQLDPNGVLGTSVESWAYSINVHGDITGAIVDAAGVFHGFVRRAGGALELVDFPGASGTQGFGINDNGSLIGVYYDAAGTQHAFTLRDGQYRTADVPGMLVTYPLSINNAEVIVGEAVKTPNTVGFGYLQQRNGGIELATAPGSAPEQTYFVSINDRRQVLGGYFDGAGNIFNFIRRGARYTPFDLPAGFGAVYVSAQTINDGGDIVGYWFDAGFVAHGFVANATKRDDDDD